MNITPNEDKKFKMFNLYVNKNFNFNKTNTFRTKSSTGRRIQSETPTQFYKPNMTNQIPPNINFPSRIKSEIKMNQNIEKEKLYDECIHLKVNINNFTKEIHFLKSQIMKKDLDLQRQNKAMQEIISEQQNETFINSINYKTVNKIKENNLVNNLKKQYSELRCELKLRNSEIEELKRTLKYTKIREVQIENKTLIEEMNKMKEDYAKLVEKSYLYENLKKENFILQENLERQEMIIYSIREENINLQNGIYPENGGNGGNSNSNYKTYEQNINENGKNNNKLRINSNNSSNDSNSKSSKKEKIEKNENGNKINNPNLLTQDQINEFSYILLKNFQCKRISSELLNDSLSNIPTSAHSDEIVSKLISLLRVKNQNDKTKILAYIQSIMKLKNDNVKEVIYHLINQFNNIKTYSDKKEKKLKKKLKKLFKKSKEFLIDSFQYYDISSSGFISFMNLRKVLQNLNSTIEIKEKLVEFMIYYMKKINGDESKDELEKLSYLNLLELYKDKKEDDSDSDKNEKENSFKEISDKNKFSIKNNFSNNVENHQINLTNSIASPIKTNEIKNTVSIGNTNENKISDDKNNVKILTNNIESNSNQNPTTTNNQIFNSEHDNTHNLEEELKSESDHKIEDMEEVKQYNNEKIVLENKNKTVEEENEEEEYEEEEDEQVTLTMKEFNQKVDQILQKMAEILIATKKTVKEFFQSVITLHSVSSNETYESILLLEFITALRQLGMPIDTIDIYCIYTKLKYSDEYEMIHVDKLVEEMQNYGIFEDKLNMMNTKENIFKSDSLIANLHNYLEQNHSSFDLFLFPIIGRIELRKNSQGVMIKILDKNEFMNFLQEKRIQGVIEDEFLENKGESVNITSIMKFLENNKFNKSNDKIEEITEHDYSVNFDNIENMDIDGLDD